MIGLVVYALAQFATLRRIQEEEEEAELQLRLRQQQQSQQQQFLAPPSTAITPPTPQNGTIPKLPQANSTKLLSKTSMWLPSVGALQLSESSILKRRASLKRKRSLQGQRQRDIRKCSVDCETLTWIEKGLDRLYSEEDLMLNVLNKWHAFLKTRVMQDFSQVSPPTPLGIQLKFCLVNAQPNAIFCAKGGET